MNYSIFDVETDGLLEAQNGKPEATKIHCLSVNQRKDGVNNKFTLVTYDEMRAFLMDEECLVGHNIVRYDIPILEKFLSIKVTSRKIDTLALSWYLYPNRVQHGIEFWGKEFGIEKPYIEDWSNQSLEDYIFRCERDVEINSKLFYAQVEYLKTLYEFDNYQIDRIVDYLMFKLDCAKEQEEVKWKLDVEKCQENLDKLLIEREKKAETLAEIMPKVVKYKIVSRPKVCFKKDNTPSVAGEKWFSLLKESNLPDYHNGAIKVPVSEERGNPRSQKQLKDWLFSLGWEPDHYKYVKNKATGEQKRVPQITNADGNDISDSVKVLYEGVPELEALEGFFILSHRIGILEGFLENKNRDNYLMAQIKGFTNTLRFQHTTIVNLPTIPKPYWEMVRGCLIAPDGHELCGSDMSSLEDNTKQHYMYYFDPEYVTQMRTPGFDPHIDISVRAKAMSYEEGEFYKWYDKKKEGKEYKYTETKEFNVFDNNVLEEKYTFDQLISLPDETQAKIFKLLKPIRLKMKKGNFASVYGAGVAKLAITLGVPHHEAKAFHIAYWIRNKAVKMVAEHTIHKIIGDQMWLFNPVSRFWYSLRLEKDKFSTLNQGTGVYCFDTWVKHVRTHRDHQRMRLTGQFHDEIIKVIPKGIREEVRSVLTKAIEITNEELRLNVPLKISIDFGNNYAEIH